jgi:toxin secretion/phage lysis holin
MLNFLQNLINNKEIKVLIIVIALDTVFGILRALKQKKVNSSIGIDGIIRKVGMLIAVTFLRGIDAIVTIDLIGFIPEMIKDYANIGTLGVADLFGFLFIIFEALSIIKNMILCELPIPKKLQLALESIMKEFTGELHNKDEKVTVIETKEVQIQTNNTEIKKEEN